MKKKIKNFVELNNFYKSLSGKDLSTYQVLLILKLTHSDTADCHKIDNSLPTNFLTNLLIWEEIIIIAICKFDYEINSGFRCPELNKKVGGVPESLHMKALAVDFGIHKDSTNDEISLFIQYINETLKNIAYVDYHYRRGNMLHVQLKLN